MTSILSVIVRFTRIMITMASVVVSTVACGSPQVAQQDPPTPPPLAATATAQSTATQEPSATSLPTLEPTNTSQPTNTLIPPTRTPAPTETPIPPTNTPAPEPSSTPIPPTDTPSPDPTATTAAATEPPSYEIVGQYTAAGKIWTNVLVSPDLDRDGIIAVATQLHDEAPGAYFHIFNDANQINAYAAWDVNYPDDRFPYPESWVNRHLVADIQQMTVPQPTRWVILLAPSLEAEEVVLR